MAAAYKREEGQLGLGSDRLSDDLESFPFPSLNAKPRDRRGFAFESLITLLILGTESQE